jgi:hypothetical protein
MSNLGEVRHKKFEMEFGKGSFSWRDLRKVLRNTQITKTKVGETITIVTKKTYQSGSPFFLFLSGWNLDQPAILL